MPGTPADNKANAIAFHDLMFNQCDPRLDIERFAKDIYIQHNPHVAEGKDAFIAYRERMVAGSTGKSVTLSGPWHRTIWSCSIVIRPGRPATIAMESTSSTLTTTAMSSNTGTFCR